MARVHYLQSSFVSGVLDPRLHARTDIRQYYQGMSVGRNVLVVPLGGVKRRPGLAHVDKLPNQLTQLQTAATATAPNGGTANNARDDVTTTNVTTTTNIGVLNPYVVIRYDLGAQTAVSFVAVIGLALSAGTSSQFAVQYSTDDITYTTLATIGTVSTDAQDTMLSISDIVGVVTARYWRIARIGATDLGTAKAIVQDFLLFSQGSVSEVRLKTLQSSTEDDFIVSLTHRTAMIYAANVFVDSAHHHFASADIPEVDSDDSGDTLILVHEDYQPLQVYRDSLNDWYSAPVPFTNIPVFDFDDASSPVAVSDVQDITFGGFAEGNTFALELDGARSGIIVYQGVGAAANQTATAENIRRAVQKLYSVGVAGVSCAFTAGTTFRITFAEDSADNHPLITGTPLTAGAAAAITAAKIANGTSRREPVWSTTRGWPRTIAFHEGRLWFGGSRSLPGALFASVVNDPFNFEIGAGLDDDAIFVNPQEIRSVRAIFSGRDLQVFTSKAEFRFVTSPITPSNALPKNQTKYGARQIKPVSTDGATVYIQKTGKVLRDFLFRYEEDSYSSVPLSQLASHLLNDCVDLASWQGSGDDDANYTFIVNGDGTIAVYCNLRSQEISAFTDWDTDGKFKAVGVSDEERYAATLRNINGTDGVYLERMRDDQYMDASVSYAGSTPVLPLTGLTQLEGETCQVRCDGFRLADVTVSGGSATPERNGDDMEIGLGFSTLITTMPLSNDFGNGDNFLRKKRAVKLRIDLYQTLGLSFNGKYLPDQYFDFTIGEAPDPFTGCKSVETSSNWDEGPLFQSFSQDGPFPMHIRAIDLQVESS